MAAIEEAWWWLLTRGLLAFKGDSQLGPLGSRDWVGAHREVDYEDATFASEVVLLADLLLRIADQTPLARARRASS